MNKIKVTYFFRKPQPQYFSIEKVFKQVIAHLPEYIEPCVYKLNNGTKGWGGRIKALLEVWINRGKINHITGDITFIALALPKKGLIVTFHDLESLTQYKGWRFKVLKHFWVTIPVKRAQVVTAISKHTKQQLIKWTGCNPDKIIVIPNPLPEELQYSPKKFDAVQPTILVMGTKENKNVEGIFEAVNSYQLSVNSKQLSVNSCQADEMINRLKSIKMKPETGDRIQEIGSMRMVRLIIVGKLTESQNRLIEKYDLEVENLVHVPYEEILDAYKRCDVLCFPSFYEGFGLPIIEAQAVGRPVITSNIGAMKEIAGEAAVFVDPYNVSEIRDAIELLIRDDYIRMELVDRGLQNVKRFSPDVVSLRYGEVYVGEFDSLKV